VDLGDHAASYIGAGRARQDAAVRACAPSAEPVVSRTRWSRRDNSNPVDRELQHTSRYATALSCEFILPVVHEGRSPTSQRIDSRLMVAGIAISGDRSWPRAEYGSPAAGGRGVRRRSQAQAAQSVPHRADPKLPYNDCHPAFVVRSILVSASDAARP
jgi:hypothetical protein